MAVTEPVCCAAAAITAIAAPEREVRCALQLRLEIIFSSAKSGSEVIGDIEGDLTEKSQLLFGSGVIVIEGGQWPSGTDLVGSRYAWHRFICQLIGRLSARAIVLNLKVTEGVTARIILEFTQRFRFHIAEVHPGHHSPATIRIRADSQLVSGAFVGRGIRVPFSRIEACVLVRRAGSRVNVAATQVVSNVAATIIIVSIVDDRIDLSV